MFECSVKVSYLENEVGFLYSKSMFGFLSLNDTGNGTLFFIKEVCISIWKKNAIFLFDSHGRNNLGQPIPNGYSMVMRFKKKETLKSIY